MSKIHIYSLGGLQENGKNLYVCDIDDSMYILDCGLKYPTSELYGIDNIVPDFNYLIEHKDRIRGIFLTHGHDEHIGSIGHLLKEINVNVYASRFTIALVKDLISSKFNDLVIDEERFIEVDINSNIKFKDVNISFFNVAHNIPDALGIIIHTKDGNIVYTGNFTFDQNAHQTDYRSMYEALVKAADEKVLVLMSDSLGALNEGGRGTILEFKQRVQNLFTKATGRIICSLFSSDLQRIQMIIDIATEQGKQIAILGRKTQRIVNLGIQMGYLKVNESNLVNLRFIDDKNKNNDPNLVVIVTGERHEPYFMLQRMAKRIDRLVKLEENDSIIILTKPYQGTEKMAARTLDMIYRVTVKVNVLSQNLLIDSHADREEIKQMLNILKPKYFVPVIGEYRHQYANISIAQCVGFNTDNLKILDNGDILEFLDGNYVGVVGSVPIGESLMDGQVQGDVNDVVMRDRELLAEDGVLLLSVNISPKTKQVLTPLEIVSKGFTYLNENEDFKEKIKEVFDKVCKTHLGMRFINWSEFKLDFKSELSRLIYKTCKANPIIIPVFISTDLDTI